MKKQKIGKALLLSLLSLGSLALAGCSSFIEQEAAVGIAGISTRTLDDGNTEITITYTDEDKDPSVFIVNKGNDGSSGNGIQSITYKENDDGSIDVTIAFTNKGYENQTFVIPAATSISEITTTTDEETGDVTMTVYFSDGSEPKSFLLPRGKDGKDGVGIKNITSREESNGDMTLVISLTDDSDPLEITLKAARGVKSISGTTDENGNYIITVEYSDGSSEPFTLSGPTKWLSGVGAPSDEDGKLGDFYLDTEHGTVYQKTGDENSSSWVRVIDLKEEEKDVTVTLKLNDSTDDPAYLPKGAASSYVLKKGSNFYSSNLNLPVPVRINNATNEQYSFAGWWAGTNFSDVNIGQFTNLTTVYSDITIFAKWVD